jgi:hypothetical protein
VFCVVKPCSVVVGYQYFRCPYCLRLQVFQVEVLWVVTPCSVVGYQRFGGPCCIRFHPEDGGSRRPRRETSSHYVALLTFALFCTSRPCNTPCFWAAFEMVKLLRVENKQQNLQFLSKTSGRLDYNKNDQLTPKQ